MGEVYRDRDTKLDRDVSLKVLPQAFTDDPDRLARFEREAKVLASLNHPKHRTSGARSVDADAVVSRPALLRRNPGDLPSVIFTEGGRRSLTGQTKPPQP